MSEPLREASTAAGSEPDTSTSIAPAPLRSDPIRSGVALMEVLGGNVPLARLLRVASFFFCVFTGVNAPACF